MSGQKEQEQYSLTPCGKSPAGFFQFSQKQQVKKRETILAMLDSTENLALHGKIENYMTTLNSDALKLRTGLTKKSNQLALKRPTLKQSM